MSELLEQVQHNMGVKIDCQVKLVVRLDISDE